MLLTATHTSNTAKIIKKEHKKVIIYYPSPHHLMPMCC